MTPALSTTIDRLLIGQIRPFGPNGEPSAIAKQPVDHPLLAGPFGLVGDRQADTRHHGGPDKAIHHYPAKHYAAWAEDCPQLPPAALQPGGFGENISCLGLDESNVCVGDVFRCGSSLLQVSQARQPCWKLAQRFGIADMPLRVQLTGRSGWYYRVLEPGTIEVGCPLQLLERPYPQWPLQRLLQLLYHDCLNQPGLQAMAALEVLPDNWRELALRRLQTAQVEDWSRRLTIPETQGTHR